MLVVSDAFNRSAMETGSVSRATDRETHELTHQAIGTGRKKYAPNGLRADSAPTQPILRVAWPSEAPPCGDRTCRRPAVPGLGMAPNPKV